jgi:UDP-glucose 4-epimerase
MMKNTEPHILVTGGAGFIGSHLTETLVRRGLKVRVLDNLKTGQLSFLDNVINKVDFCQEDIRNPHGLQKAMDGIGVVYHLAALASIPESIKDPDSYLEVNGQGTLNVLKAAQKAAVRRVILASTSAVYGDSSEPSEVTQAPKADNPYAASKLLAENLALFYQSQGLETIALRLFNVYGPRQSPIGPEASVVPIFVRAAREGSKPVIYGDGEQSRDFVEVRDVVEAFILAGQRSYPTSGIYNVGTGQSISINQLYGLLKELAPHLKRPIYKAVRPGDVQKSVSQMERTKKYLKFSAHIDLREGLAYFLERLNV